MAFTHQFTIICDDIRREDNGKLVIIGMYAPDIIIPQIPFVLPSLAVLVCLRCDRPGTWNFRFKLATLETGKAMVEGMGQVSVEAPGYAYVPFKFGAAQFQAAGTYTFTVDIDEHREPIISQFNVVLRIPVAPKQQQ